MEPIPAENDGQWRLWVPLLDGVERLGVLDVMVTGDVDVQAEDFQEHCRWIAA